MQHAVPVQETFRITHAAFVAEREMTKCADLPDNQIPKIDYFSIISKIKSLPRMFNLTKNMTFHTYAGR